MARWRTTRRKYGQHLRVSFYVQTGHVSRLDLLSFQAGQLHVSIFLQRNRSRSQSLRKREKRLSERFPSPLRSPVAVVIEPTDEGKCRDLFAFDLLVGEM